MKICSIQMNVCAAEPEQNFARAELLIRQSAKRQPDVILLPELWNTGFAPKQIDASLADEDGARTKALCGSLAKEYGVNIVAGSVLARKSGALYNTDYVFDRAGSCIAEYDKTHLFSPSGEGEAYVAGNRFVTFPLDGIVCGIMICYDLRFPELCRVLALSGAKVLFIPAEWPRQRTEQLRTLLSARAIENQMCAASDLNLTFGLMRPCSSKTVSPRRQKVKPPPPCQPTAREMPPCSPSITFCRRGAQYVTAWSPISMPM